MIDFRYLLITVVAIFLALTVGIVVGAGFLGEPLRAGLERDVQRVRELNGDLRRQNNDLNEQIANNRAFAESVEPWVVDEQLAGRQVVLFSFDGTAEGVLDNVRLALEESRAELTTTVGLTEKLALREQPDREQLALILGSDSRDPAELRSETAARLGDMVGEVASQLQDGGSELQVELLLSRLAEDGFVAVDREVEDVLVPPGASFVIAGGNSEGAPFPASSFAEELGMGLGRDHEDIDVLAAEPSDSTWGIVQNIRESSAANPVISTVDQIENAQGRISLVLGLAQPSSEPAGHYGTQPGATDPIPEPFPGD
jgi:hypothetical protein